MIGAVVLELKSANNSSLPVVHGKWLHAAFFNEVAKLSPEMATELHEENGIKPSTVSELEPVNLKDIKKMREKDEECKEFLRQLLVLDPDQDKNDENTSLSYARMR